MATHLRTELVLEALNMALWQRRPEAVVHHSDQGRSRGINLRASGSIWHWSVRRLQSEEGLDWLIAFHRGR